jgi:hypothetical protein
MLAIPDRRIGAAGCQLRRQRHIRWAKPNRHGRRPRRGTAMTPDGEKNSCRCREHFMGARTRPTTRGNHGLGTDPRQFRGESRDSCVSDGRPLASTGEKDLLLADEAVIAGSANVHVDRLRLSHRVEARAGAERDRDQAVKSRIPTVAPPESRCPDLSDLHRLLTCAVAL